MFPDALPERFGRYALIQQLARGGMGEVFLARVVGAHGFEKKVAVKRILPQFAANERFRRMLIDEAKTACFLSHPNIAQVLELGEVAGQLFLVMEYVPGKSLSELLKTMRKKAERLSTLEAVFIGLEMCQGLHAAHNQTDTAGRPLGIIHRDVSPQNLLISHDGLVKVIDFGIARARDRLETTEAGSVKGKVHYMAPEQLSPEFLEEGGEIDHRVDVFAAGVVIWEALAGRRLFKGKKLLSVIEKVLELEIPDLREEGVDDELWGILSRALERDRLRRWPEAGKLAAALRGYLYTRDPEFTSSVLAARMEEVFGTYETLDKLEVTAPKPEPRKPASVTAGAPLGGVVEQEPTPFTPTGSIAQQDATRTLHAEGAPTRVLAANPDGPSARLVAPEPMPVPAAAPPRRSRAPIFIAAGVALGVLVAGGAIFALEMDAKEEDKKDAVVIDVTPPPAPAPAPIPAPTPAPTPVPAPPAPAPAKLRVQVTPTDARVTVLKDGAALPVGAGLDAGDEIVVRATRDGYLPQEASVKVTAGVEHFVSLTLVEERKPVAVETAPPPPTPTRRTTRKVRKKGTATLILSTGNEWAEVYIDGIKKGQVTPMRVKLSAGRHKVLLKNPITKRSRSFSITLKPGAEVRRDLTLE